MIPAERRSLLGSWAAALAEGAQGERERGEVEARRAKGRRAEADKATAATAEATRGVMRAGVRVGRDAAQTVMLRLQTDSGGQCCRQMKGKRDMSHTR